MISVFKDQLEISKMDWLWSIKISLFIDVVPSSTLHFPSLFLQSLVAFPKLKRQVMLYEPHVSSPKDFTDSTLFFVNQEFSLM